MKILIILIFILKSFLFAQIMPVPTLNCSTGWATITPLSFYANATCEQLSYTTFSTSGDYSTCVNPSTGRIIKIRINSFNSVYDLSFTCVSAPSCPSGFKYDNLTSQCIPITCTAPLTFSPKSNTCVNLSLFDGNSFECRANGGFPSSSRIGLWGMKKPIECLSSSDMLKNTQKNLLDSLVKGLGIGNTLRKAFGKALDWWVNQALQSPLLKKDTEYTVGLPKIQDNAVTTPVTTTEKSAGSGDSLNNDAYYNYLRDEFFPKNPSLAPEVADELNIANIDRWNRMNEVARDNNADPIPNVNQTSGRSNISSETIEATPQRQVQDTTSMYPQSLPFKDPPNLVQTYPDLFANYVPKPYSLTPPPVTTTALVVPQTNTVARTLIDGFPSKVWTSTSAYPDGSSGTSETIVNEPLKKGSTSVTTVSPTGKTSTVGYTFDVPGYVSDPTPDQLTITKTSPIVTVKPTPLKVPETIPLVGPDGAPVAPAPLSPTTGTGQDLINAAMPSFSFPALSEFTPFNLSDATEMVNNGTTMINNIKTQLDTAKTSFDTTKTLITGGWTAPTFPSGSCGNSLTINFRGHSTDLCPPMLDAVSKVNPIFSNVVAIGGMAFAVSIFIGGF